jgi:hypothetical protein
VGRVPPEMRKLLLPLVAVVNDPSPLGPVAARVELSRSRSTAELLRSSEDLRTIFW